LWSTILRLDSDQAASLGASSRSCAEERCRSAIRATASLAAQGDVVFERETELGFLFVRSGTILARRRLLEDLYSFR
jgi:hypothetical protein